MSDRHVPLLSGGPLAPVPNGPSAWLDLTTPDSIATMLGLIDFELATAIEALATVSTDVVGADAASVACGVHPNATEPHAGRARASHRLRPHDRTHRARDRRR